ncbi:MAG: DUF2946 family protein [Alphaproteobacteria bacterium]
MSVNSSRSQLMRSRIAAAFAHAFLVRLTLVALLVGALLPAGWMPNPDGLASGTPIVMCTGHGPMTIIDQGMDHAGKPAKQQNAPSDVCVFAAAAAHATPVSLPALNVPRAVTRAPARQRNLFASVRVARYRPQAARAPPLAA